MNDQSSLAVFWPEDAVARAGRLHGESKLSAEMSLPEFFWQYAWPDCLAPKGDSKRTRKDYAKSLDYWVILTDNPPVGGITKRTLSQFVRRLAGLPLARNTVYKHWVNVERLIRWTGPASRQNREGIGLVEVPAWTQGPRKQKVSPREGPRLDEINSWLEGLVLGARPILKLGGIDPVDWWAALILFDYNTGLRPGSLFRLRWEDLDGHWIQIAAVDYKGQQQDHRIWLNEPALRAITPLRRAAGLVFAWEGWPRAETTFRKHRRRTQQRAGIQPFSLYGLRRRFCSELGKINPLAAQIMMGHRGLGMAMMIDHYIDRESILSDALSRLPQPGRLVQRRLF